MYNGLPYEAYYLYFIARKRYDDMLNQSSHPLHVVVGVSQGLCLGTLFLYNINQQYLKKVQRSTLFLCAKDLVVCSTDADFEVALSKQKIKWNFLKPRAMHINLLLTQQSKCMFIIMLMPYYLQTSLTF